MAVYIDNFDAPFGRMLMCHMIADTTEELLVMCDIIGVQRKWIQSPGTKFEHFDICNTKKKKAVSAGAIEVMFRDMAIMRSKRDSPNDKIDLPAGYLNKI